MSREYDVVIIGAGPGGYNCAIRCGQLGLKAALVEKAALGGTCLNLGCIPSKSLLHASERYARLKQGHLGMELGSVKLDLAAMMRDKSKTIDTLGKGVSYLMKKNKVTVVHGRAELAAPGVVRIVGDKPEELRAKNIVIAVGSEPAVLPGIELDEQRIVSNSGALSLDEVPERMVLIGAGVIGLEMGSIWSRLGSQVIVLEYLDRILPGADSEIASKAMEIFSRQGLEFRLQRKVTGIRKLATTLKLSHRSADDDKSEEEKLNPNVVVVAAGRCPATSGIGLDKLGVALDERGFIVTENMFCCAEGIWAIGDCIHGPMLAHKAEEDGVALAELLAGKAGHVDYDLIPSVVYTDPEIAWIGKTEDSLKSSSVPYKAGKFPFSANSRAMCSHAKDGFVKILAHADTDLVLGAHLIGNGVSEMLSSLSMAMSMGASSEDIARTCLAHPTMSEAIRQAAMGVEGLATQI